MITTYTEDKPGFNSIITPPLIYDAARLTSKDKTVARMALELMSAVIIVDKIVEKEEFTEIPEGFIETVIKRHKLINSNLVHNELRIIIQAMIDEQIITSETPYRDVAEIMKKSNGFGSVIRILAFQLQEDKEVFNSGRYIVDQLNWALRLLTDIRTSGRDHAEGALNNMVVQYMKQNNTSWRRACLNLHNEAANSIYNMYLTIVDEDKFLKLDSLRFACAMSERFHILMKVYLGLKVGF
jgi:hypothetical protein